MKYKKQHGGHVVLYGCLLFRCECV